MPRPSRSSALVAAVVGAFVVLVVVVVLRRGPAAERPEMATATLDNGVVVDVARVDGTDRAAAALLFRVGADHDPQGRSGLASVLRRAVRGRLDATTTAVPIDVDGAGAFTVLSTSGAPADVDQALRALGTLLAAPRLGDEVVATARASALDEVARRRGADPLLGAESWALESVAPSRGQGWRGGVADEIAAVTRDDVENAWRATFGADVAGITVVGDVDVADTLVVAHDAFSALPRSTGATLRAEATTFVHGTLVMGDRPRAVAFATPGPAPGEPSYAPFVVLAARLASAATAAKFTLRFDPAMGGGLVVTSVLGEGETADDGAARLRSAIVEVVKRPLAAADLAAARARYAVFLGDVTGCAASLQSCAVARARRAQLGITGEAIAAAIDATTSLDEAAAWFDEQHATVAAAGGVLR